MGGPQCRPPRCCMCPCYRDSKIVRPQFWETPEVQLSAMHSTANHQAWGRLGSQRSTLILDAGFKPCDRLQELCSLFGVLMTLRPLIRRVPKADQHLPVPHMPLEANLWSKVRCQATSDSASPQAFSSKSRRGFRKLGAPSWEQCVWICHCKLTPVVLEPKYITEARRNCLYRKGCLLPEDIQTSGSFCTDTIIFLPVSNTLSLLILISDMSDQLEFQGCLRTRGASTP